MIDEPDPRFDDLGQSYQHLLEQQNWEVDAPADSAGGEEIPPPSELASSSVTPPIPAAQAESNDPPPAEQIIEALLFVGGGPLTLHRFQEVLKNYPADQFAQLIEGLSRKYRRQGRPYGIATQGAGYLLELRPRFKEIADRLYGQLREARLSTAAIDVLSLVAYRQPATKAEIDGLRGADSGALLRQLVRRGFIAIVARADSGRKDVSYGTTQRFLDFFGLKSLDDLPHTQELDIE